MDRKIEMAIAWDCQKVWRQYYHYVDHHEYEKAVELFTVDVTWRVERLDLQGRAEILEALYGGLGNDTIRHVVSNTVVNVIDEDHAELSEYHTIYYSREGKRENMDGPLRFKGPHRLGDSFAKFKRVDDEWQIAAREQTQTIFQRHNEPMALSEWAKKEKKVTPT